MKDEMTCAEFEERGFAERYAAGTLDDDSVERFESHFITCARCQQAIELAATLRAAARPRRNTAARWMGAVGVLAAAALVFAALTLRGGASVRALGALDVPPAYGGVSVRGPSTPADSAFAAAMQAYASAHYTDAAAQLQALAAAQPAVAPVPVNFFLGASLLMNRQPARAAGAFARVIAAGDSPYLAEAHYYRALALLQQNRPDSAGAELRTAVQAGGASAPRAQQLLQRLEEQRPR